MKSNNPADFNENILDAIFDENELDQKPEPPALNERPFIETAYLEANPDVAQAIWAGDYTSGWDHYSRHGKAEGRATHLSPSEVEQRPTATFSFSATAQRSYVDAVASSEAGYIFIVGWSADKNSPIERALIQYQGSVLGIPAQDIIRHRRADVESALGLSPDHDFGFLAFSKCDVSLRNISNISVVLVFKDHSTSSHDVRLNFVSDQALQRTYLGHLESVHFFGNRMVELSGALDKGFGPTIIRHNFEITGALKSGIFAERYGGDTSRSKASIIVCLYGKAEFMFVQSALFSSDPNFKDYEFVYVSNSPELADELRNNAKICNMIYGVNILLIILPGNLGFGGANNIAARLSKSDRMIFMNPDVFPMVKNWSRFLSAIENLPESQKKLFGATLFYDDGSLMHGGMYFELETGLSMGTKGAAARGLVRVEHYGKGAPAWHMTLQQSRPVPAVTGALIGVQRSWFEQLGGFTEEFVFGHYEDADLCLKSMLAGQPAWIHPIPLWHLEGKGSNRRAEHEGASLINRWLFARKWANLISNGLSGQNVDVLQKTADLIRQAELGV